MLFQTTSMNASSRAKGQWVSVHETEVRVIFQKETSHDPETQRLFDDSDAWAVTADRFSLYDNGIFALFEEEQASFCC
ncbi:MAG: hypothetical protein R8G34_07005 [Paracoccaceae bacterium]|nr:hypothetical protein [Paracoccaceae bacterium]